MPGEGPDHLRVRSFTLSLSLHHLPSSILHSPPIFPYLHPSLFLISAALALLMLSSGFLVRLHSVKAETVKRDIFHEQKITKVGVRTRAPNKACCFFANFSLKYRKSTFECVRLPFKWVWKLKKPQPHKCPLTASDQLAASALLTLCDWF